MLDGHKQLMDTIKQYMTDKNISVADENLYRTTQRKLYDELGWEGHKDSFSSEQIELLNHIEFLSAKLIQRAKLSPHVAVRNAVRMLG